MVYTRIKHHIKNGMHLHAIYLNLSFPFEFWNQSQVSLIIIIIIITRYLYLYNVEAKCGSHFDGTFVTIFKVHSHIKKECN